MSHRDAGIVLAEGESRDSRDSSPGDQFADEDDAALGSAPDIEAEIHLFKRAVERDSDAAQARAVKLEGDEADVGSPIKGVEFRPGGDKAVEQGRVDSVIEHYEVHPLGGQEDAWLFQGGGSPAIRPAERFAT